MWQIEAARQKEEGFIETLSAATLQLLNEDLTSIEGRIMGASVDAVSAQVEERYQGQWKHELLARVREDVIGASFRQAVSDEIKAQMEEVSSRMRTVASQSMLAQLREHAYSKPEVTTLLQSNAEACRDHMVQVACRDIEALQEECRELSQTVTDMKAYMVQHAGERADETPRKQEEENLEFERKMLTHIHTSVAGIETRVTQNEDEVKRALTMAEEVEQRLRARMETEINRLDTQLAGEKDERLEADVHVIAKLVASENKAATVATVLENSLSDHCTELLSAISTERARITANHNSIVTAQTTLDTQTRALAACEDAVTRSDQTARNSLEAVKRHLVAFVDRSTADVWKVVDAVRTEAADTRAAVDGVREDVRCVNREVATCTRRQDTFEVEAERAAHQVRKNEVDISWPLKEMRAELDLVGDIKGQLISLRSTLKEEREERAKEFTDLRRDLDFVVRPLLGDAGDNAEGNGNLITSLARTCVDWQKEMQLLRDKVKNVQQSQHEIDRAVKNMFAKHKREVEQFISYHKAENDACARDVCKAAQETMNWVRRRRTSEELQIEEHFLRQGKEPSDSVQLSEAMREMLTELHRQMSGAECLLASQIEHLHRDGDKMQKVVTKVQHAVIEMQTPKKK